MDRDQFDAFNSLMAQEAESGDYDDLIEMAEGGPVGEDMESEVEPELSYFAEGGSVKRPRRAAQMLRHFADGGDVAALAQDAPVDRLLSPTVAAPAAVPSFKVDLPTFNPVAAPLSGPNLPATTPASLAGLGTQPSLVQPMQAPTTTARSLFEQISPTTLAGTTSPYAAAATSSYTPTVQTFTKPTLLTKEEVEKAQPPLVVYEPSIKFGGIKSYQGPLQTSPYRDETQEQSQARTDAGLVGGTGTVNVGNQQVPGMTKTVTPLGYEYTPYTTLTPEQIAGSGNKAQILDMFKGIVTQQEKDVNNLRSEYVQAMSYGNMPLAASLKDILIKQEGELTAAKADQLAANKYFTGAGGAYETPAMYQARREAELLKGYGGAYTGLDLGAIGVTPETKADPFTAALTQQKNEYTTANTIYGNLSTTYGKDSQVAKDYFANVVNPQKEEYDRMLAVQKAIVAPKGAADLYTTVKNAAAYKGYTAPTLAEYRNVAQTEAKFAPVITGFENNIKALTEARNRADAQGLSGYVSNFDALIQKENEKLEQARGARQSAVDQAQPDPMRDYILGKQLTAQKIEGFANQDWDFGKIDFSRMNVNDFQPLITRQQQDQTAAKNTYDQLVGLYGANNDMVKAFKTDVLDQQLRDVTAATNLKTAAQAAITAYNTGKSYAAYTRPNISISKTTSDKAINDTFDNLIRNTYEKRIGLLDAAKAKAEQAGLGQYGEYFNTLMNNVNETINQANRDRDAYFAKRDQLAGRAAGSPPEGEISDPVQRLIAQQSRTKDQGMDSTARAMLKKFAGGGEAKTSAAPETKEEDGLGKKAAETLYDLYKEVVPAQARTFAETALMPEDKRASSAITEKNFSESEKKQMLDAIITARKNRISEKGWNRYQSPEDLKESEKLSEMLRAKLGTSKKSWKELEDKIAREKNYFMSGKGTVNYMDYPSYSKGLRDFTLSPEGAIRNTLGRFVYQTTPEGKIRIKETYDFGDDLVDMGQRPSSAYENLTTLEKLGTLLVDTLHNPADVEGSMEIGKSTLPGRAGSAFIGKKGRPVDITIDPREIMPGYAGYAHGGPVHRADGSLPYGEIATGDSGVTADTLTGLRSKKGVDSFASEAAKMLRNLVGEGVSNIESGLRGSVAAIPGSFGDIESIFRESDKTRKLATTEEVLRDYMPKRLTKPTKEAAGFEEVGTYLPLPVPPGAVSKVAKGVKSGAKKALEELGPTAADMAEKQLQKVGLGPMQVVPEGPSASLPLTMTERTEQGRLFRGRLDDLVAEVRNPVTKGQFLGSLRGKAREYEISRAAQALQDLDDAAKITPAELSSRIDKLATPSRYRTTFIEPKDSGLHNRYDNVYGAADHPVGVINLSYVPTHEAIRAEEAGNKVRASISSLGYRSEIDELLGNLEDFVKTSSTLVKSPEKQKDLLSGLNNLRSDLAKSQEKDKLLNELSGLRILNFPEYKGSYGELLTEKMRQAPPEIVASRGKDPSTYSNFYEKASEEVLEELRLKALQRINAQHPLLKQYLSEPEYLDLLSNAKDSPVRGENKLDALRNRLAFDIKAERGIALADNNEVIQRILAEADKSTTYKGSHAAVNPEKNAMGFSRFTEHTVNVPGMGKLGGIYVSELQSDMFRDIKKMGKLGGSRDADTKEIQSLVNGIKTKLASVGDKLDKSYGGADAFLFTVSDIKNPDALSRVLQGPYIGMPASKANSIAADIIKDGKRIEKLKERAGILTNEPKGTYQIEEPIANIETQPQVVQQLLAKNAIAGAIQRGKSFVAFPGVESKQAKLYEKLPNNLKQVIKDLGEGFVMQPITIKAKDGVERTHLAVIWDNNAAQRIMNQGVPFKKGGLVDKNNANNRKYI